MAGNASARRYGKKPTPTGGGLTGPAPTGGRIRAKLHSSGPGAPGRRPSAGGMPYGGDANPVTPPARRVTPHVRPHAAPATPPTPATPATTPGVTITHGNAMGSGAAMNLGPQIKALVASAKASGANPNPTALTAQIRAMVTAELGKKGLTMPAGMAKGGKVTMPYGNDARGISPKKSTPASARSGASNRSAATKRAGMAKGGSVKKGK